LNSLDPLGLDPGKKKEKKKENILIQGNKMSRLSYEQLFGLFNI